MSEQHFPLHPSQQDVYLDQLLDIDSPEYNIGGYIVLRGGLDKEKFHEAVNSAPAVFDAFKMRFDLEEQDLLNHYVEGFDGTVLTEKDFSGGDDPAGAAKAWMHERFNKPFRLTKEAMPFEQYLIKITEAEHWFFGKYHHLITDGYGFIVYVQYVASKYRALISGEETLFSYPLYREAAVKANQYYHSAEYREDGNYWKEKIPVKPAKLLQRKYHDIKGKSGTTCVISLCEEQRLLLSGVQVAVNAGLQQLTIAALIIYFGKITSATEIILGVPIHKRGSRQLRNTVGMFSGVLPFKGSYNSDQTLSDLLKEISTTQRSDYRHQNYLVGDLSRELKINPSEGYLCDVLVNYEPLDFELDFGEAIEAGIVRLANEDERNPLQLCWRDYGQRQALELQIQFLYEYFTKQEIELLSSRILFIIEQFTDKLDQRIESINLLPAEEADILLKTFNDTAAAYPKEKTVIDLFEEQEIKTPGAIAIVFEGEQLTYKELNERSNRLAHYLQQQGVKTETLVPIFIERGPGMVVGILGILKAGGAYVPIDPDYPQDRISYMVEDTGAKLVLSSKASRSKISQNETIKIVEIDGDWETIKNEKSSNPGINIAPNQLAYVIYTSGSTGKPKGVMIEHGSLVNLLTGISKEVEFTTSSSFLSVTTYSFDICYLELYVPLIAGSKLIIVSRETASDGYLLAGSISANRPTHMQGTPSTWQLLADAGWRNEERIKMLIGGETVKESIKEYLTRIGEVWNVYGPTETTIWSTVKKLKSGEKVTIGKPIANTQVYILTPGKELSPIGVAGEICIGGDGLARGYLNRPELTKEKFIADPFSKEKGTRLYKTGDLGRWLPDGNLEHLGRIDDQVKIRGYRIELGEIESVLNQSEQVSQGAVLAKEDSNGNKRLVGYVVPEGAFDKQGIQAYLQAKLPDYMVPSLWVELQSMPLTPNGKTDRKALPDPEMTDITTAYVAPRNETETQLAQIWQELLGIERVGIHDNFFELGGHSLLAMRVVSSIRRALDLELNIRDLFAHPTVAGLSAYLGEQIRGTLLPEIVAADRPEYIPLSFSQERLWFIDKLEGSVQYHMPSVLRLNGDLDRDALGATLREIVHRHEVLRTVIREHEGLGYQHIMDADRWVLGNAELNKEKAEEPSFSIERLVSKPFDLSSDYMLRADLIKLDEQDYVLVVTVHHIASDGWSMSILVKEVVALYASYAEKCAADLPLLNIQYADYAIWQRKYMTGELLEAKLGYWKEKLEDVATLQLPTDYSRPVLQGSRGATHSFSIEEGLSSQLADLSRHHGVTLYMTLLAAFKVLLYRYSGQEDICVGTPIAGRNQRELEGLIGFFVNTLALRSRVKGDMTFTELLGEVKATTLEAYEHQEVPFEKVVDAMVKERDMSRNPLFQVLFVFQNTPEIPDLHLTNLRLSLEEAENTTTKFDVSLYIKETNAGIRGTVEYNTDLYKGETIDRLIEHYVNLLGSVVSEPGDRIGSLAMLGAPEEEQLLKTFNATAADYPGDKSIADLFEQQAAKSPEATAVVFEQEQLSYKALNERSNQLARYLQKQGVKAETLVPICLERGLEMIIGILGILKAGGAYVPIDPEYPQDRIRYMLEDTGAELALSSKSGREKLNETVKVIAIDGDWDTIKNETDSNLQTLINPEQLAYVIYTSGSTGKPKGAMNEHGGVVNRLSWAQDYFKLSSEDTVLQKTTFCFDVSVWELLWPLLAGARLVFARPGGQADSSYLKSVIEEKKITMLHFVPSMLSAFLADLEAGDCRGLKNVLCSGEALSAPQVQQFTAKLPGVKLHNLYGPTEAAIDVTYWSYAEGSPVKTVPIGRPVWNTQLYILSNDKELCPVGVTGELYIGGVQVGRGYLNRPELTNEKFISDPFSKEPNSRLYKTGDLARWLPDGNIEYQGRVDDQVKIRGYRIELGEIESVLNGLESVQNSCVLLKRQDDVAERLISYYIPDADMVKAAERQLYSLQINGWRELYENEYRLEEQQEIKDPEFNIITWNDSFTFKAVPEEQMREWQQDIIEVILAEQPKNVLEIGCGTGLIYYPLAGKLKKYTGTDLSRYSIEKIKERIGIGHRDYGVTAWQVSAAHEIVIAPEEQIDTIIINSVVQYFPGADYLSSVIENSIGLLKGKGRIIIGDIRDNRLLGLFKARLHLSKIQRIEDIRDFKWAVEQEAVKEEELCFAPEYFYNLRLLYPDITHVAVQWKKSSYNNELSRYRYTVILYVGIEKEVRAPKWESWEKGNCRSVIFEQLKQGQDTIAIKDAPNPRLWQEQQLFEALHEKILGSTVDLLSAISQQDEQSGEIETILQEADARGYQCRFLLDEDPFKVNILLEQAPTNNFIKPVYGDKGKLSNVAYTNTPLFTEIGKLLQKEIKSGLQRRLPDYMVPSEFIALQYFPLNSNGKIDRKFLSQHGGRVTGDKFNYQAPRNATEQALSSMWQRLLNVERLGINDNFFELGGHSLLAIRVVSAVRRELNIELNVRDLFNHPTIAGLGAYLDEQSKGTLLPDIEVVTRPEYIPLSFSQERLWFIDGLEGSVQYHLPAVLRLKGSLDHNALERTLRTIIGRHEVLRTIIKEHKGQGYQHIMGADGWTLGIKEGLAGGEAGFSGYIAELVGRPFDLSSDYMLRADLIKLNKQEHILAVTMHHIASDGWSISILVREVVELYASYIEKRAVELPVLKIQYADYSIWQRKYIQGEVLEEKLGYWKQKLAGAATLQLPTDYSRPVVQSSRGATHNFKINKALSGQLVDLSHQQGATLFMTLLTAFKVLLYRYSGQEDICVGTPIAGRGQQELEGLIGFFVNTLALRSRVKGDMSFSELLNGVKVTTLEAYEHQEVPFEKVVDAVVKERDLSRNPLFQVMLILMNTPEVPELHLTDLLLSPETDDYITAKFDISLFIRETSMGIEGTVEYCTDLYREETIERMIGYYINLLDSVVTAPENKIGGLGMLGAKEEEQLLKEFNDTAADYPKDKSIVTLFEEQAAKTPETIALIFGNEQISYKELNERSNQLARYLQKQGVRAETLVPICIERSLEMVVGILGILKAGGAYVPIDPEYPQERISYMLEDTGAKLVLSSEASREKLATGVAIIEIDGDWEQIGKEKRSNPGIEIRAGQLAYVIYTSGSTGKPKGVMIEHGNAYSFIAWCGNEFSSSQFDIVYATTSICFDLSVFELFYPLSSGKPIRILEDGLSIGNYIGRDTSILINTVPSVIEYLLNEKADLSRVSVINMAGEPIPLRVLEGLDTKKIEVRNLYGPTEDTTYSTISVLENGKAITIGKPIWNTHIYILSGDKELSPIGVTGEICIGGAGLARGYLNRPELTNEKFISDPFSKEQGARLYKTGDLARWLPDGNVEYQGRVDDQVKIRGYRIELGEIESVLNKSEQVRQGLVLAKEDKQGNKRLIGYVVPNETFDKQAIQSYLSTKLPEYMVPAIWVEMEVIPLTPNGKIDRKALPDPDMTTQQAGYTAPRNATEVALVQIWQELLGVERVGIYDNFFELGGHSLLAMRVVSLITSELNIELNIRDLFAHPAIAGLGEYLDKQDKGILMPAMAEVTRPEYIPLSFSQERLWFIDRLEGSVQYHLPEVLRLKGELNGGALSKALAEIVNRHEILRTVYREENGAVYQEVKPAGTWVLRESDGSKYRDDQAGLDRYIAELTQAPFDLCKDDMFRGELIRLSGSEHILVVTVHHIASDASSMPVLVREVASLYEAYVSGIPASLPVLPLQYADYAVWQRNHMQGEFLEGKLKYWKAKLAEVPPLQLPADYERTSNGSARGATVFFEISAGLSRQVQELGQAHGATLYMTLLAAFKVLLYRYSGQEDICVGTSVANRPQRELEGLIGFFVNTLALRDQVRGEMGFTALLGEVKATMLGAYGHQEVPFEKVVDAVVKERQAGVSPLFQVMLVLINTPETPELKLGELSLSTQGQEQTTAKFDLTLFIRETKDGMRGAIQYNTDLYSAERIARMASHFTALLQSVVNSPQTAVGKIELLGKQERAELQLFGISESAYPKEATLADLFEAQAQEHPQETAVVFAGEAVSYKELNERANGLAQELQRLGVKAGTLVPLYTPRGIDMLTGILGILKAGGAYVPIDTEFPADRISYMLEDTGAQVAVSSGESTVQLQKLSGGYIEIIGIDSLDKTAVRANPQRSLKAEDLAYVIYTSGSTGKPKGVTVSHGNVADYVYGLDARTGISKCKSYALVSTIATDLGNTVLYSSLLLGGTLHVFTRETVSHIEEIHEYFEEHRIDCLKIVPSHWKALSPEENSPLLPGRMLIFGGEALPCESVERIRNYSTDCRIFNHYGPTETTVGKLVYEVTAGHEGKTVPVGKPFSNTRAYILSKEMSLCPIGVPGQLYIAGQGVARGYLNRPELTAEKFIQNPNGKEGERMYATGDRVVYQKDGNIVFIGRADDQVKIRGYRVEPGEITRILEQSEHVSQAIVLAREDKQGNMQLVGYIVAQGAYDKAGIQAYLKAQLPDYMVPSHLVELQSMPLTANGKIDRKALPDPEGTQQEGDYTAPRNETEAKLAEIWQDILELDQVGINDDFFGIGGHSLLAVRLVSQVRKSFGMELPISDVFDYPTVGQLATRLTGETPGALLPAVTAAARPEYIPLSFSQERLWFIDKLEGSVQYHVPAVLRLEGSLDPKILEKTLQAIINRHEVLRTVIKEHEGRGYQQIMSPDSWALGISEGAAGGEAGLSAYIAGLINEPFDLSADYMLRADLITLSADDHILAVTMHHIASDGWSRSILVREVAELYKGYAGNAATDLPLLNIQYADYAIWQRSYMAGELLERKLGYWRAKLAGVAALQLPTDYSRPPIQSSRGAAQSFAVDAAITAQLRMISQAHGATLYMTLLAAFKVLLYRYSGQEDICTGAPVAGRNQQELEGLIGFFVNTLALRDQVRGEMPFIELLQEVKATTLEAYAHQEVPFEKVVDAVVKERDRSRNPLFQVLFSLENTPEVPELKLGGLRLQAEQQVHATAQFDISFLLGETASGIRGTVEYSTDLYKGETIDRLIGHYISLLGSVVSEPGDRIGSLAMLGAPEEEQLLIAFNATAADYPGDKSIADLFEQQAAKSPEATAVVFEQEQISYKALNERSNQLARYLQKQGVKTETLVPICLERGLEMIIGILGILKAGGAYVPIDPEYPQDRIRYMLEDTGAELALSSKSGREKLNETVKVIAIDGDWDTIKNETDSNLQTLINPEQLAYVIYTSGSTGKPKGAMNEHGGVVNRLSWAQDYFKLSSEDTVLQKTTFCFDVSVWELLWPLLAGARLVFARPGGQADSSYLKSVIAEKKITMLHFVPSMLSAFLADLEAGDCIGLKNVLCSGEALSAPQVQQFTAKLPGVKLHNLYGPTEAAIDVTYWSNAEGAPVKTVPIGRPVWNTQLYILSNDKELCPVGVTGELYIGGVQVGRGYLNRPELTNEKFIKDPFSKEQGARLYKTGDLARWLPDGNIEYQGRVDDQVKIRGYRIELGEIESVLNKSEQVRQGLVLAKEDKQGNKRLVGYVVPNETFDKQAIQSYLSTKLPEYMVPAIWVELSSIPLTPNGKTDRRALPDPDITAHTTVYTAPRNETEADLAQTWQELLGLEKIGIYDNFFELGGDSILTIQVVSRMRRLGYLLQPKDIFNHQEIAGLSAVTVREGQQEETGEQGILSGAFGLLPIQSWYLEKAPAAVSHFNQSVLLKIDKRITAEALALAQNQLIAQHDALRLTFEEKAGEWQQAYGTVQAQLWQEDLRASRPDNLSEQVTAIADKYQGSLSVTEGRVVCMVWLQTPEKEAANRLLLIIHHLAVDGVSWRILLEDLEQLLSGAMEGRQVSLGAKSSSYRQWHAAIAQYSHSQKLQAQKAYWENVVNSYQPLPEDKAYTKEVQVKDMRHYQVRLKAEQTRALLQEVAKVYHTEINDLLLSALSGALCSWSGADQVVIGLEGHGREAVSHEIDSSRTVGWFTSLYPVELPGNTDEDKQIKGVKEALRGIPEKGLGYGVLKYLEKVKGLQGKDPWDVLFNYLGQLDTAVSSGRWLSASGEAGGKGISEEQAVLSKLSVNSYITGGELVVDWGYSSRHYNEGTVVKLAEDYINHLTKLIAHCIAQGKTGAVPTPSDYGLGAEISYQELDSFLEESSITRGDKGGIESISRLSGLQQGMLFHGLYDNYGSYIEQFGCDLVGVKIEALLGSWSEVIKRHSILRSAFYYDSFSVPVQCVYEEITLPVEELDYRGMDEQAQAAALKEYEAADRAKGFDFKSAPLMRLSLIRLTEDHYRMVWAFHHMLIDGWSLPILMEEFLSTYELLATAQALPVRSEDRYEDYIRYLEHRDKVAEEQYWRGYLGDIANGTLLPFIRTTTERTKGGGKYASLSLAINEEKAACIQAYAQSHRLTVNTLMQGVWAWLLHRYTGEPEVLFGAVVSGRPNELAGVEHRVGMYINTLPFKTSFGGDQQTDIWLQGLQAEQVSSRQYQHAALQDVQEWTGIKGDLFDTLLVFENYPVSKLIALREWSLEVGNIEITEQTNFPLTVIINSDELGIKFSYNTDLLEEIYVRAISEQFEQVLLHIAGGPAATLKDIRLLTAPQEEQLLKEFNDTAADYPKDKSIVTLFEEQAAKTPETIALIFGNEQISYKELNERSNQLARYLQKQGVRAETLVPICIERSLEMVVGILGILKAGGAYVPIDPEYPQERISYMLEDTGAKLVLSSEASREKLATGVAIIEIDGDWEQIGKEKRSNPGIEIRAGQLAYVIYTSGSTGKPKGVMIEHGNAYSFIAWCGNEFSSSQFDIVYATTSICFDLSVFELFYPLSSGKPIRILEDGLSIGNYIGRDTFILINTVPSVIDHLINEKTDLSHVSVLNMAGEPIPLRVLEGLDTKKIEVRNLYGPTEDTTYSTISVLENGKAITIGKPIWNTHIYILSGDKELSPIGVTGEICIGGAGLARGYLNRRELTNEKFISDPFSKEQGARLYKTGDLARWLPDGNIEYLGRVDDQVKIRGYRIELGEIESVLNKSEQVRQGLVLAKEDKQGNKRLVGYVVPNETFDKQAIQSYLSTKLPEYMVPAIWVELSSIPLTPNGKTDRRALPDPDITAHTTVYTAPRNETEADLAQTWQELLGLEKIGIYDNFFELGGDSILTIQVVSRMRRLGYLLQPKDIFNHQEIAGLAAVTIREGEQEESGEQGILSGAFGLLPIQSWYLEKAPAAVSHFNQSVLLKIDKRITAEALALAQNQLMTQHDALRLTFEEKAGEWQQAYGTVQAQLWQEDLRASRPDNLSEQVTAIADKYQGSLSVTEGRVVCMVWLQTPEKEAANRLLLIIHHLAVDGVSWRILLEDLEQLLSGAMEGRQVSLGAKSSSYRQWHAAIAQYSHSQKLQAQKAYWENVVNSYQPLPEDKAYTKEVQVKDMRHYQVRLKAEQTRALLQEVAKVYHTEINDLLLSALSGALCSWSGADQVVIGLEGHGREAVSHEIDSSRTVGWFTSLYPVELPGNTDEDKQIKGVKEALRGIPEKGLGYGVLKYLEKVKGLQGKDPWDVLFNYLGQLDTAVSSGRWLSASGEAGGKGISEEQAVLSKLSVNSYITGGELVVDWGYSSRHYNEGTVVKLAEDYINHLTKLIAHCIAQGKTGAVPTPSDYGLGAEISYQELDSFLEEDNDYDIISF